MSNVSFYLRQHDQVMQCMGVLWRLQKQRRRHARGIIVSLLLLVAATLVWSSQHS